MHSEGCFTLWAGIVVVEVIDEFLDPDGTCRGAFIFTDETPEIGVGRGIDIDGKGREGVASC